MSDDGESAALGWARDSACVHRLADARVVRVTGEDAQTWLNGQTTNDIRQVGEGEAVYALSLDAKGRIQADLWVVAEGEGLAFVAPASATETLLAAMDRYIIMEDLELEPDDGLAVVTVQGPRAADVVAALDLLFRDKPPVRRYATQRLGAGGFDLWVPNEALEGALKVMQGAATEAGGGLADEQGWVQAHVLAGVPRYGADFDGKTYPQEVGLRERAVSFDKGCYLGQEVVCMLENRGKLARRLVQLTGPANAAVQAGDQTHSTDGARVGQITSVAPGAPSRALALLKSAHTEAGTVIRVGSTEWTVDAGVGDPT